MDGSQDPFKALVLHNVRVANLLKRVWSDESLTAEYKRLPSTLWRAKGTINIAPCAKVQKTEMLATS